MLQFDGEWYLMIPHNCYNLLFQAISVSHNWFWFLVSYSISTCSSFATVSVLFGKINELTLNTIELWMENFLNQLRFWTSLGRARCHRTKWWLALSNLLVFLGGPYYLTSYQTIVACAPLAQVWAHNKNRETQHVNIVLQCMLGFLFSNSSSRCTG
jgi:hypothetical protein